MTRSPDSTPRRPRLIIAIVLAASALWSAGCGRDYYAVYEPTPPPAAYEAYLRARLLRERGEHEQALEAIDEALAADRHSLAPWVERADLLRLLGRTAEATDHLDALVDAFPDQPAPRFVRARLLHDLGNTAAATAELDTVLAAHPDHVDAAFLRAELAIDAGHLQRATEVMRRLVEHRPRTRRAWLALGNVALEAGDLATAVDALTEYTERNPHHEVAWLHLARAHRGQGDAEAAEAALAGCVEALPSARGCKVDFIRSVIERPDGGDLATRVETLELAVPDESSEVDDQQLARLATRVLERLPLEASSPFIERVLQRRPGLVDLAFYLGRRRFEAGDFPGALWALGEVPATSERAFDAATLMLRAQLAMSRADEAAETGLRLVEAAPERLEAYLLAADSLSRATRHDEAAALLTGATEMLPRQRTSLILALADVHRDAGQLERAAARYREVLASAAPTPHAEPADPLELESEAAVTRRHAEIARAALALGDIIEATEPATAQRAWRQGLDHVQDPGLKRALEQRLELTAPETRSERRPAP